MADSDRLDENELKALLAAEIRSAIIYDDSELSQKRARAMRYYDGDMADTPANEGRSSVVSRDVADTIGWMLPGIMRVFTASDQMADYEPVGTEDEQFARQATDLCNHVFWKDNPGYRVLWNATHDSLLQGNGIVKHWWDDSEDCCYSEHSGLTEEQIAILVAERDADIVAQARSEHTQPVAMANPQTGQVEIVQVPTFDVKLKRVISKGRVRIECIEPENFLIDRQARTIEEARFCAHRNEVSRSDLIEMGFDRDVIDDLPSDNIHNYTEEALARAPDAVDVNDVGDRSTQLIELHECYIKADADGDGISETVRAYYAGHAGAGELLNWEVWDDDLPFSDIPCAPVPHRWDARSIADETMDVQRIKTVLLRQALDNLYASNLPQQEMEEGSVVNPDALVNPKFGQVIIRRKGSQPLVPRSVPFVADKAFAAVEYFDQVVERRTGVSRSTMALDPDVLQNQTATAVQNQRDAAYSQIELVARNMAELGWRRVFREILKLVVKHQDRERVIRLKGRPMTIDPRHWNANMDVTINVGLGSGSRDRDMAMLNNVLQSQVMLAQKLAEGGFADKVLDLTPLIRNTLVKITESAGLKNPGAYYPEIEPGVIDEMKRRLRETGATGEPKAIVEREKAQAMLYLEQQKVQLERQRAEVDMALKREKQRSELALKREQLQAELLLRRDQLAAELALKQEFTGFGGSAGVQVGGRPG